MDLNHRYNPICLANNADRPISLLSVQVGREGLEPPMSETTDLQAARFSHLHTYPDLAVQTGLEPANYTLEGRAARPLRFCTLFPSTILVDLCRAS